MKVGNNWTHIASESVNIITLEKNLEISNKDRYAITIRPTNFAFKYLSKENNVSPQKDLYKNSLSN